MANKYRDINGNLYTESQIKSRLSKAYKEYYLFEPLGVCEGCCVRRSQGTAHIVPKARCKQIGRTEMIWNPFNWFPSCYHCNQVAENPESAEIKTLKNYQRILKVTEQIDPERFIKMKLA